MGIVECISCSFETVPSPDQEHLKIKVIPDSPHTHLDNVMLSLKLAPNTPVSEAQALEG